MLTITQYWGKIKYMYTSNTTIRTIDKNLTFFYLHINYIAIKMIGTLGLLKLSTILARRHECGNIILIRMIK